MGATNDGMKNCKKCIHPTCTGKELKKMGWKDKEFRCPRGGVIMTEKEFCTSYPQLQKHLKMVK